MASDSERRNFFSEAPSEVAFLGAKKACNDSAGIEVDKHQQRRMQNYTERVNSLSFPTDSIHCH